MNFDDELKRLADRYASQGYQAIAYPTPEVLPPFARDFKVEILARRGNEGVLVAVKKNRAALAADSNLPRYAEVTQTQPKWRFDLAVLEGGDSTGPRGSDSRDFSSDDIKKSLEDAEKLVGLGLHRPGVITAWAALEAAMRMRLRAAGEQAGWGTSPRVMMNELYSSGIVSADEFHELEKMFELRNEIVHGFASPSPDSKAVEFLAGVGRRLVVESGQVTQLA